LSGRLTSYRAGYLPEERREIEARLSDGSLLGVIATSALGAIDFMRCFKECHPGAVYLHRGKTWLVTELDLVTHEVTAVRQNVNYFTRTKGNKTTEILKTYRSAEMHNFCVSFGYLRVTDTVTGFQRRLVAGQKMISMEQLDLPPLVFETSVTVPVNSAVPPASIRPNAAQATGP